MKLHFTVGYVNSLIIYNKVCVFFSPLLIYECFDSQHDSDACICSFQHVQLLLPVVLKSPEELADGWSNLLVGAANNHVSKSTVKFAL